MLVLGGLELRSCVQNTAVSTQIRVSVQGGGGPAELVSDSAAIGQAVTDACRAIGNDKGDYVEVITAPRVGPADFITFDCQSGRVIRSRSISSTSTPA